MGSKELEPEHLVIAIVLAAGSSKRMGDNNKLLSDLNGKPIVQHVIEAAMESEAKQVLVVTGYQGREVAEMAQKIGVVSIQNSKYKAGLSTSLKTGIEALPKETTHALILLGDMPFINAVMIDQMISVSGNSNESIVVATHNGELGNPVLWPRSFFDQLLNLQGDSGAKPILSNNLMSSVQIEIGSAAKFDVDTTDDLKRAKQVTPSASK